MKRRKRWVCAVPYQLSDGSWRVVRWRNGIAVKGEPVTVREVRTFKTLRAAEKFSGMELVG